MSDGQRTFRPDKLTALTLVVCTSFFGFVLPTYGQERLSLDALMSRQEQRETGVSKLSASERQALEKWLTEWGVHVYTTALQGRTHPATGVSAGYSGLGSGHWIRKVSDGGRIIELEDGSLWEVSSVGRVYTMIWLPVTEITVFEAEDPIGDYKYILVNTDDGENVHAKLLGQ